METAILMVAAISSIASLLVGIWKRTAESSSRSLELEIDKLELEIKKAKSIAKEIQAANISTEEKKIITEKLRNLVSDIKIEENPSFTLPER